MIRPGVLFIMVMDIMVLIIFVGAVFFSMRKGFALTAINFIRTIASLVLGFLFADDLRDLMLEKTGLGAMLTSRLETELSSAVSASLADTELFQMMPELLQRQSLELTGSLAGEGAIRLSHTLLTVLSFFLIMVAIGLAASLLSRVFSKKYAGGFFGFIDWLLGGLMGIISGFVFVFVFLAAITPLTAMFAPGLSETLSQSFAESRIAGSLYDNNLLLLIFTDFLG